MRDITFGAYYASNSKIHKIDPRIKMLIALMYMIGLFFIDTFFVYGVMLLIVLTIALIAKLPLLRVLKSIRGILALLLVSVLIIVLASTGTVSYTYGGTQSAEIPLASWLIFSIYQSALITGGLMGSRLLLLMLGPTILTLTTTPMELTDALDSFMTPLKWIKFPVYALTLIMSIALRFVPTLFEETDKIIRAQKARCAGFDSKNIFKRAKAMVAVLVPLFISALRHAGDLADAMDSRCFKGAGRTRLKKLRIGVFDCFALLGSASLLFMTLLFNYNWWECGWLTFMRSVVM